MITIEDIQQLREETQAPIMECKKALEEAKGDFNKAKEILKKKGELKAIKKQTGETSAGIIDGYIHSNGQVAALVELRAETDFVSRNADFKQLAHDLAMHIAAMNPTYLSQENIPGQELEKKKEEYLKEFENEKKPKEILEKIIQGKLTKDFEEMCLMNQTFIKDETKKISDLIKEATAKFGEKIEIKRFVRFAIRN
ncbi:MAG TPA: elongation factor Ts [Candidatus Paceibacterota bacterium]|nr:elongation factor Ts [Candidatus Paceibacterota bacterium]